MYKDQSVGEKSDATWPNLKKIREELQMSQTELATLLGVSPRTIQSCEQGWRSLGQSTEKCLLLVLMVQRHGQQLAQKRCWEVMKCSAKQHEGCLSYRSGQGSLCWFFVGNKCSNHPMHNWEEKKAVCRKCKFFQMLLPDCAEEAQV